MGGGIRSKGERGGIRSKGERGGNQELGGVYSREEEVREGREEMRKGSRGELGDREMTHSLTYLHSQCVDVVSQCCG